METGLDLQSEFERIGVCVRLRTKTKLVVDTKWLCSDSVHLSGQKLAGDCETVQNYCSTLGDTIVTAFRKGMNNTKEVRDVLCKAFFS